MDKRNQSDQDERNNPQQYEEINDVEETSLREKVLGALNKTTDEQTESKNDEVLSELGTSPLDEYVEHGARYSSVGLEEDEQPTEKPTPERDSQMSTRQKESKRRKEERQKENSMVKKIVTIVVMALVVMLVILGVSFYKYWQAGLKPLDSRNKKLVQVEIPIGTSNKGIGSILEKNKVIKSGFVFTYYVKTENLTAFKGGYYQMSPDMTLDEVAEMLQQGGTDEPEALADAKLTIPEGYTIDQMAELFAKKTGSKKADFINVVRDEAFFNELTESYPKLLESAKNAQGVRYKLEGYLFPATYNYYKDTTVKELVTQMVDKTNSVLESMSQDIAQSNHTIQEILTLASLVEKEGVDDGDRRKIAQVFYNRIDAEMPLQSDISIIYALNEHKVHLSEKDTQIDSPYNLYINKGFGPGPFNNPSAEAIEDVLHPEMNDYIYFLADIKTHKVYFAKTYDEHLEYKKKYIDDNK